MCKPAAAKFSVSMHPDLLERMDKFCAENFQSRSGLISIAVKQYLESVDLVKQFGKLSDALSEMKSTFEQQKQQQEKNDVSEND